MGVQKWGVQKSKPIIFIISETWNTKPRQTERSIYAVSIILHSTDCNQPGGIEPCCAMLYTGHAQKNGCQVSMPCALSFWDRQEGFLHKLQELVACVQRIQHHQSTVIMPLIVNNRLRVSLQSVAKFRLCRRQDMRQTLDAQRSRGG